MKFLVACLILELFCLTVTQTHLFDEIINLKDKSYWRTPFCPKEQSTLAITCGVKDSRYMGSIEYDAIHEKDLVDPTRCTQFRYDDTQEVDFVVIGSGSSGSVVAGRLSEEPNWQVMMLEAGESAPTGSSIPSMYFNYVGDPVVDYSYKLIRQDNVCLRTNGTCKYPRGKVVGGTGIINGMMYMRGNPADYNKLKDWGIQGWSYKEVLPYFLKSEDNLDDGVKGSPIESEYHARGGPLTVSYYRSHPNFSLDLLSAYKEMGYNINIDLTGKSQNGFALAQATNRNGARLTTAKAYIWNNLNRENLIVLPNARVYKIIINASTLRAEGVMYERNGIRRVVRVRKEIILSAGSIESPHLLLASGVGPREHLEEVGVTVIKNRPGVGMNLNNHVSTEIFFRVGTENNTETLNQEAVNDFFKYRQGVMTSTGLSQLTGFLWTKYTNGDPRPDLQIFHAGFIANCSETGLLGERAGSGAKTFSISPTVLNTLSTGWIKLRDGFPFSRPLIYGGILTEEKDRAVLLEGIRFAQNITNTKAMKDKKVFMDPTPQAGCEKEIFDSDDYWKCYIAQKTNPENHQTGTCRMGAVNDSMAVTDSELRVIGLRNIRVADSSVYPRTPSGNLQAPAIMVAERAADFIKDTWYRRNQE